jgi:FMN-dependent NADH-azoreductase
MIGKADVSRQNRPVFVGIASGGRFTGDQANQPDFLTPYLSAALGCIGLGSIHYLPIQGTAFIDEAHAADLRVALIDEFEPVMLSLVLGFI